MAKSASPLTPLELRLMQQIWQLGPSTVSAVQGAIDPPLAYTTVQTMLNILERKGHLQRKLQGRAFVYSARVSEGRARLQALRDIVDRMFGGSSEQLVMTLVQENELDPQTLQRLALLLEAQTQDSQVLDPGTPSRRNPKSEV